ncbi:iron complex transport system substrate-binding protein [Tamilnaduibacter salinus]|uniref:Iron complex transport system substrate-binding protein n=1 Tax=Tamilnaduibacter salinus TaxID=1484056 RepID=A0A2U1CWQ7_9GAMM|nr:cobalamin-binding protein [Tamilnaduibacter salinus]PVY76429.1 iron complex transport system substrate-binding protein [Tamilnaduibacter salinus]
MSYPQRIVCLTEETTETLYAIGAEDRIVGISGFTVRPERARKEKPKVSAFTSARIERIRELEPDLVLGFSDMQADIAAELVRAGIDVHIFNHRTVAGILTMIRTLGGMLGLADRTDPYADELAARVDAVRARQAEGPRPRVYFEEWGDPMISGIGWVSELIGIAGGDDIFPERAAEPGALERIIKDPQEVVDRQPDIIIGSWCGRKFRPKEVAERPGWDAIPAVANNHLYEVKSPIILQPGPAALTDGLEALCGIVDGVRERL